jgi:secondary thiamine-phosphate synthase enzyme
VTTYRGLIKLNTKSKTEVVDITGRVEAEVSASRVESGIALVYPLHTSSAVYVGDSDRGLRDDLLALLARLVPAGAGYRHDESDEKRNAHAHLAATLAGHSATVPVGDGELDLGTFQRVYYLELDGGRPKEIVVKVMGA